LKTGPNWKIQPVEPGTRQFTSWYDFGWIGLNRSFCIIYLLVKPWHSISIFKNCIIVIEL
jgi:hypothetical protein